MDHFEVREETQCTCLFSVSHAHARPVVRRVRPEVFGNTRGKLEYISMKY